MNTLRFASAMWVVLHVCSGLAIAQDSGIPTVIWNECLNKNTTVTLHDIAERAKPMLWFSRDEPLLNLAGPLPREWPRMSAVASEPRDLVYYRVTALKASISDNALVRAWRDELVSKGMTPEEAAENFTTSNANPESIADIPLNRALLLRMAEITIRYMFYYPNELGAKSHRHDLESAEYRVVFENASELGVPTANGPCRQIRVATIFGAAHGLGLYTNVLDLDDVLDDRISEESTIAATRIEETARGQSRGIPDGLAYVDPFWPLVILVEEGKHASAPDRNGDGIFTPTYDVNKNIADAWGARDTMRTRALSPVFRADTFKQRIPPIVAEKNGGVRSASADPTAVYEFRRYLRHNYVMRRATADAEICGAPARPESERRRTMHDYAATLKAQDRESNPEGLLDGKRFCDDANVLSHRNLVDFLRRWGVGGNHNGGFTHWWERISGSIRFDGGFGWTGTIPVGYQLPGIGGWLVARLSGPWPGYDARKSIDLMFMPSSARFADWYIAAGLDRGTYERDVLDGAGQLLRTETGEVVREVRESGRRSAVELGMKFRVPVPNWGTFFGGRVGFRTNGTQAISNGRLVFEFGAGIW